MCGIVGYLGPEDPKNIILAGLKKLEYRGYDSAGVSILDHGSFRRVRAEGKLVNLENKLKNDKFDGGIGIGHTRWATHGVPSERNAHPHTVAGISLVHNGIIENYLEIKEKLLKEGATISSDTDSELVAHLIAKQVEKTKDLPKAVFEVLPMLQGAFSILVVWEKQPEVLVAFKDGPPLILGVGEGQSFVVSDVQAALAYTNKFVYLDDREVALVRKQGFEIFSVDGKKLNKKVDEINWTSELSDKRGYAHYMLKEIYEQPQAFSAAIEPHVNPGSETVLLGPLGFSGAAPTQIKTLDKVKEWEHTQSVFKDIERISIVACGTSYYAGLLGKYLIEERSRLPVEVDVASEFRYRNPPLNTKTLLISISQSGETADTLAAVRLAKTKGVRVLSLCNVVNSTIDREAHGHMYMNAGTEIGVASTKAFMCTLGLLQCLSISLGRVKGQLKNDEEKSIVRSLLSVPSQLEAVLNYDKYFADAAESLKKHKGFLYMGRGVNYPMALEGALKMKELAYLHAEGYAAGEMKHGPLALIDKDIAIVMIVPKDELYDKTISNLEEAKARGGQIISIGTGEDTRLRNASHRYLSLPSAHPTCNPILAVVPLQLMAYHMASTLGHDVDQPRNLAKSVTVE
jgi:glucosamine--fructose-6-phosphate aminotransferase (isomerizing)